MRTSLNPYGFVGFIALASACGGHIDDLFSSDGSTGQGGATNGATSSTLMTTTGDLPETGPGVTNGSGTGSSSTTPTTGSTSSSASGNPASSSASGNPASSSASGNPTSSSASGNPPCSPGPNEDRDKDGWTLAEGDCNDCDPNVNPAAIEIIAGAGGDGGVAIPIDDDCDGKIDNVLPPCDDNLLIDDLDPMNAAKAADLCKKAVGAKDWGVISAKWVLPDGAPAPASIDYHLGHGLLDAFGPNVRVQSGQRLLALSSGTARRPTDADYKAPTGFDKMFTCNPPQGFAGSTDCSGTIAGTPHDAAALEVSIRAPSNVHGFSFDFNYFTYEWPNFVCSEFSDFFVSLLSPVPAGHADGNISFDPDGFPVSANSAFVNVCGCAGGPPCMAGGKVYACSLGNLGLTGTGFDDMSNSASTSWLVSRAPVTPGQTITVRWAVYDSGDGLLDSTTLVDHWQWIAEPGTVVGTSPVSMPK